MMAGKEQNVVLPPELWKEILQKLWQSEEDLKDVITCREVCRSWEELVDKMPPNPYWNPWFSYSEYLEDGVLNFHPATSFTPDSDVIKLLQALPAPGSADAGENPFRNQTVRLFRHRHELHQNDVKNEEENLLMILSEHGHRIRKLLWNPHDGLPERLVNLPLLLSSLTNLRTLIINSLWLSNGYEKIIRGEDFPKELKHLRELLFQCSYHGGDLDDTLYEKLSINYGSQIKSITFSTFLDLDISKKHVLGCYPNLEDLKIAHMDIDYWNLNLQPSGYPWPKLRRLAISWGETEGSIRFSNVLRLVCCFSETLELLSLQFERSEEKVDWPNSNTDTAIFRKLEKLVLPLSTMYNARLRQPITISIERRLNLGFPALKTVVLDDMEDAIGYRGAPRGANPTGICETLWPFVPSSVETISIRNNWRWYMRIGRKVAHFYKCSRIPTN